MSQATASEPWIVEQRWDLTYTHSPTRSPREFLRTLRDEGKVLGIRCPVCRRVLAPPRPICDRDFCETEGWVELGTERDARAVHDHVPGRSRACPRRRTCLAYVKSRRRRHRDRRVSSKAIDLSSHRDCRARESRDRAPACAIALRDERAGRITDLYFRLAE